MAKKAVDAVLDGTLDILAGATRLFVCSAEPSDYADASGTVDLATVTIDGADFTKANDTSGRKVTISEQATITVDHSGDATHIAYGVAGTTTLLGCTTCTTQTLTAGNTVTVPAHKWNVQDPT